MEHVNLNDDKMIDVCKISFWDGSNYILNCNKQGWDKIKDDVINDKQKKFNKALEQGKIAYNVVMASIKYERMELDEYETIPASQYLHKFE